MGAVRNFGYAGDSNSKAGGGKTFLDHQKHDRFIAINDALEQPTTEPASYAPSHICKVQWGWIVVAAAILVFLVNIVSPPHLMDDVDAVQAQIARNMLASGDWVTARLDGVPYLEKSPLIYWMMAISFRVFGVHDWAARLPLAMSVILLCWIVYRIGVWAFDLRAGLYAGLALATSVGLFLFTRILIPDAILTLTVTGAVWSWLRLLESDCESPLIWQLALGISLGAGLLLKGLIAVVFPVLTCVVYMSVTHQIFSRTAWRRLGVGIFILAALAIAMPWHLLAMKENPPYFAFSMHSAPGEYRGFFWFYFFNEHLLRFLNLRYPRDYNTVPRLWFWLLNLVWLFPWSAYLLAAPSLSYSPSSRAGRVRLIALCWIAVVMGFFTFSTTQEYYSMPIYPALALLIGSAVASNSRRVRTADYVLMVAFGLFIAAVLGILVRVWQIPVSGDISNALVQHPSLYTLSLGHLGDLTISSFAYLKFPLALAATAFAVALLSLYRGRTQMQKSILVACSMVIFFNAARLALVRFDSYLGSYPLAQALEQSPPGKLIESDAYYAFSSVFFYSNRSALLLNGRIDNLEYGSYAPEAPDVFIDDARFAKLWSEPQRWYLLTYGADLNRLDEVVGSLNLHIVARNADNYLLTNHALP